MRPAHWAAIPSIQRWKPFIQKAFSRCAAPAGVTMVHPVPLGQCIHKGKERCDSLPRFRMEQAAHIPSQQLMGWRCSSAQGVQGTLSHYLIRCVRPLALRAIFGLFRQHCWNGTHSALQVVLQTVLHSGYPQPVSFPLYPKKGPPVSLPGFTVP